MISLPSYRGAIIRWAHYRLAGSAERCLLWPSLRDRRRKDVNLGLFFVGIKEQTLPMNWHGKKIQKHQIAPNASLCPIVSSEARHNALRVFDVRQRRCYSILAVFLRSLFFFFARHAWRSMVMKKVMFAFPDSSPFPYRDGTRKNQHRNTPGI